MYLLIYMNSYRSYRLAVTLICFLWVAVMKVTAQDLSLKLVIKDSTNKEALVGVNAVLRSLRDTTKMYGTVSDVNGLIQFNGLTRSPYRLSLSYIGYHTKELPVRLNESKDLGTIYLIEDTKALDEFQVKESKLGAVQKGDTTEYNADAFKTNPDADVGDLIKKMPGVTVDKDGVQAQGEQVKKVLVDGQEFFGDDATLVLKNLPAEIVDKIQVYDQQSEQSKMTGFDDGNTQKTINIVTKTGKANGQFGKAYAGYGTDNRYNAGVNFNVFNGKQRISVIGMSNNINQQNFASQDLLGVLSVNNSGRGRGRGGFRGGVSSNPSDFLVGQQSGISTTHSLGLNYIDVLANGKLKLNASYFITAGDNENTSTSIREYFVNENDNQNYSDLQSSPSYNLNHRFNMRLEYTIDSNNTIFYRPQFSTQANFSNSGSLAENYTPQAILSLTNSQLGSERSGFQFHQDLGYRHSFAKKGRSFALSLGQDENTSESFQNQLSENTYYDAFGNPDSIWFFNQQIKNPGYNSSYEARVVYSEPISKKSQVMFQYNPEYAQSYSDRKIYLPNQLGLFDVLDTGLSGELASRTNSHRFGLSYRLGDRKRMLMISANYQMSELDIDQEFPTQANFKKSFKNFLPMAFMRIRFSQSDHLRIFYRSSTQMPSASQLLEVVNNSNPLLLSQGNKDLKQQLTNRFGVRYNKTFSKSGRTLFAFANMNINSDVIGSSTFVASSDTTVNGVELARGTQLTRPVNLPASYEFSSFLTFGTPLKFIKSNLNLNLNYRYTELPGLVNDVLNKSVTNAYNISAVLSSNISEKIDFTLSYTVDFNKSRNSLQPSLNNDYVLQAAGGNITWNAWKSLFLNSEVALTSYKGLGGIYDQQFALWNAAVAYKFLKNNAGEFKLSVFDILKQNNSISRTITETYIENTQTEVLQQYYMLTFTYTFRNFRPKKLSE